MINRKIKNATTKEYDGILFKSTLEVMAYKTFKENGLNPLYEPEKIVLIGGFKPTTPYYTKNKRTKEIELNLKKVIDLTYSPDFVIELNKYKFYIELKGFSNDTFPIKRKLFRRYLETRADVVYFELYSKKDVLKAIEIMKHYGEEKSI